MTDADHHWSLSNPGPDKLFVWLEPWAEEFEVPTQSTIVLVASGKADKELVDELEWTTDHLVLWVSTPGTVKVFVDGELQESASALVPLPEGMTKQILNIAFANHPAARLGGRTADVIKRKSSWQRARR